MYDLGFKIFQWFTVYPRFKVYNLGFGVQNLGYRIQYFANILTIFIYLFFVTIFMYFYYFILKIYIIFGNSILFPFLKDIKYQILNHYWLVNLQVHLGGEPKNFSQLYSTDKKSVPKIWKQNIWEYSHSYLKKSI